MTWLLKLYPREWRRRYGAEMEELVADRKGSLQLAVDLIGGAIDAHTKPQAFARRMDSAEAESGGNDMVLRMKGLCCDTGELTRREAMIAGSLTLGASLILAATLIVFDNETYKAIALTMSPGIWMLAAQPFLMRGHSLRAKIVMIGGPLVILFLIGAAAAWLVQRV